MTLETVVLRSDADAVRAAERELDAAGFPIPLPSRVAWSELMGGTRPHTALVRSEAGAAQALIGISVRPTRALPWHTILRVEAFGEAYANAAGRALIRAVVDFARTLPKVLRVVVELETRDSEAREHLRESLREAGFVQGPAENVAPRTLTIDLLRSEEELLASLSRRARQNIRAAGRVGLETMEIVDSRYGDRMNVLLDAALARTGASPQGKDWNAIVKLCRRLPERSRIVGVFRGASREPANLVGYAWGMHHGDRVEYSTGASDRIPGVRLPILYPAIWDLVLWARRSGGQWFDLGGVTPNSDEALGGVSRFKRTFSDTEVNFGEEWVFTPHRLRGTLARFTSGAAGRLRKLTQARRTPERARTDTENAAEAPGGDES